jgi:hypothetical protein
MPSYRIVQDDTATSIVVTDVAGKEKQLLEAFGECQEGRCTCPTDEYKKVSSMEVEDGDGIVRLLLEPKPGESLDTSAIAECLDYTTERLDKR